MTKEDLYERLLQNENTRLYSAGVKPQKGVFDATHEDEAFLLKAGDFYEVNGFEGLEEKVLRMYVKKDASFMKEKATKLLNWLNQNHSHYLEHDSVNVYLTSEQEQNCEVQYFTDKGHTFIQIYDNQNEEVLGAMKLQTDGKVNLQVVGEKGVLDQKPKALFDRKEAKVTSLSSNIVYPLQKAREKVEDLIEEKSKEILDTVKGWLKDLDTSSTDERSLVSKMVKNIEHNISK